MSEPIKVSKGKFKVATGGNMVRVNLTYPSSKTGQRLVLTFSLEEAYDLADALDEFLTAVEETKNAEA